MLQLFSDENTHEMSGVDPSRMALYQQARRPLVHTFEQRSARGDLNWSIAMFPTNAAAQDADMSLSDFEDFVFRVCFVDEGDPVARWRELADRQERLVQWLSGKHAIHVRGPDTDLSLSVEGRRFLYPAIFSGRSVEDVRLRFEDGVVVDATAKITAMSTA